MVAQFNSEQERKKWASLQNSAGASLNNIVQGKAQTADFQRVSTVLNGLNALAAQVFAEAVSAAEVQAKKFQAAANAATQQRDLTTLTAYEVALNDALKKVAPDIVEQIKDVLALEFLESTEELNRNIGGRFTNLEGMLPPQDLPTTNDVLAANELLFEQLTKADDDRWSDRESSLIDKISAVLAKAGIRPPREKLPPETSLGDLFGIEMAPPTEKSAAHKAGEPAWEVVDDAPVLSHAQGLLGGPKAEIPPLEAMNAPTEGAGGTVAGSASLVSGKEPMISMSSHAESAITQAASDQTNLYKQLQDFLSGTGGAGGAGGKGSGQEQSEEDEEEKADTWWKSFKKITGGALDKYTKFKKDNSGWLSTLGKTLMLMVLDPTLFKSFGDMIEKYVTFDNIKNVVTSAWDWVAKQGKNVLDMVMNKLGIGNAVKSVGTKVATAAHAVGNKAHEAASWVEAKLGIGGKPTTAANKSASTPASGSSASGSGLMSSLASGASGVASAIGSGASKAASAIGEGATTLINAKSSTGFASKYSGPVSHVGDSNSSNTTSVAPDSGTTTVAGTNINVGGNKSTITNNSTTSNAVSTTSVPANTVRMNPGVTSTAPGSTVGGSSSAPATKQNIQGTPQVGVSSFGFTTSMDDSLTMMNTSYFTG
jgi:hypothetical protein